MKIIFLSLLLGWAALLTNAQAQNALIPASNTTDEAMIRDLVARHDKDGQAIPFTKNCIVATGAYPKPIIGGNMGEADRQKSEQMQMERVNFATKTNIERLAIAQAGDMAYEFSRGSLSWDRPDLVHISFDVSYLRVWRKVEGNWQVDAMFVRPDGR